MGAHVPGRPSRRRSGAAEARRQGDREVRDRHRIRPTRKSADELVPRLEFHAGGTRQGFCAELDQRVSFSSQSIPFSPEQGKGREAGASRVGGRGLTCCVGVYRTLVAVEGEAVLRKLEDNEGRFRSVLNITQRE